VKILFVGRKFGGVAGGVERTSIELMNELVQRGHRPMLLTWDNEDAQTFYPLRSGVVWKKLRMGDPKIRASWGMRLSRQFRIRSIVRDLSPDAIIGFQHGSFLAVALASVGLGIPVIAAERNAPQRFEYLSGKRSRGLIFLSLMLAKKVTVQFSEYKKHYPWFLRNRMVDIPNPIKPAEVVADPVGGKRKTLLFVGHLSYQKNPKVLLKAFREVLLDFPDWQLCLIGDGEYRQEIEQFIHENGLEDHVKLLGLSTRLPEDYRAAQLFCLPSLWEGFPNALAEAMAHGLPSVGFADCAGVNLLIRPNLNGLLAAGNSNAASLAIALRQMMGAPEQRARFGKEAIITVTAYKPKLIFDQWEGLFVDLLK
jgi:GalNAc-alpha-(1->4)-GalNAc-alpha-(1->3)-diNAcBac-PP-undecaprenol alpha-1,4-N-acetyl-D-galactosaminyltransferase